MTALVVIDDDQDIAALLAIKFEQSGFDVTVRADGITGLGAIRAVHPGVVIADWMMPGLDGLALAEAVRADPTIADTRMLLLTARIDPAAHALARNAGFDDVFTKPFVSRELIARVRALCA